MNRALALLLVWAALASLAAYEPKPQAPKILSYSDNYAPNRIVPWSH